MIKIPPLPIVSARGGQIQRVVTTVSLPNEGKLSNVLRKCSTLVVHTVITYPFKKSKH